MGGAPGAAGAAAERGDAVAGHAPPGRDAENKARAASARDEEARTAGREAAAQRAPQPVVFSDDSGTHPAVPRLYGGAPHDQRATGSVPRHPGRTTTVVVAWTPDGLHAPGRIEGARETATGEGDMAETLVPTRRPGQGVVLANVRVQKAASMRQARAPRGGERLFLPPDSPAFTPIEQAFSKIKALLRGLGARTREAGAQAVGGR